MTDTEMKLLAAEIIADCPRSRLKRVMSILLDAGLIDEDVEINERIIEQRRSPDTLKRSRKSISQEKWKNTNNPYVVTLRKAFSEGISLTSIGREAGIDRTTVYKYLWGDLNMSKEMGEAVAEAIFRLDPSLDPQK